MTALASQNTAAPATALEVAARFELSDEARAVLRAEQTPSQFFSLLAKREYYADAIRFAAYYLPKREAIWWGCLCVWHMLRPEVPDLVPQALLDVVDWVRQPNENQRRQAFDSGEKAGRGTAAGMLASAVFVTGGSISLPELPEVEPGEFVSNQLVAAAVLIAAKTGDPRGIGAYQRHFLTLAQAVNQGEIDWELPEEVPAPSSV